MGQHERVSGALSIACGPEDRPVTLRHDQVAKIPVLREMLSSSTCCGEDDRPRIPGVDADSLYFIMEMYDKQPACFAAAGEKSDEIRCLLEQGKLPDDQLKRLRDLFRTNMPLHRYYMGAADFLGCEYIIECLSYAAGQELNNYDPFEYRTLFGLEGGRISTDELREWIEAHRNPEWVVVYK